MQYNWPVHPVCENKGAGTGMYQKLIGLQGLLPLSQGSWMSLALELTGFWTQSRHGGYDVSARRFASDKSTYTPVIRCKDQRTNRYEMNRSHIDPAIVDVLSIESDNCYCFPPHNSLLLYLFRKRKKNRGQPQGFGRGYEAR